MTEIARLQIAVDSTQARNAAKDTDALTKSAGKADAGAGKLSASIAKLGIALAGMVTVSTLMAIQRMSEEFVLLQSRIGRLSGSTEEAAITYSRLADIARRTGASLGDTVKLWEALNFTLKDLGGNNDQVIRFTETLQKIGAIGGNSAEEMSNALRQLGQALAGGVVRAEEFNSILENMPALAREIAAGLGIPFGDLRQIMLDGGLTAEKVLQALQDRGMAVDQEFAKIPRTASQAGSAITTSLGEAISNLDKQIGLSKNLAEFLDAIANDIRFASGDYVDDERLNLLLADRARLEDSLAMANKRTILSAKERAVFDTRLAEINAQIVEIQDRKIKQTKEEGEAISGNSQKAADARQLTLAGLEEERKLAAMSALEREQYKAEQLLGVGATVEEIAKARELAAQTYALGNAHKSVIADIKTRTSETERLAKAEDAARAVNERVITDLSESLYQASLSADALAQRQAELRLNEYATPEQIAQVNSLADALFRMEAKKAAGASFEQAMSTLPGGESPELERLRLEYEQKQLIVAEAYQTEYLNKQLHDAAMIELDLAYAMQRQQIMDESMARQQAQALQSAASIISITSTQIGTMQSLFDEGSAAGKAFFLFSQALAAANAVVQGFQSAMAIRVAYAQMAAMTANPGLLAAGEVHANVAMGMGFVTAGMIAAQTVASFEGGGFTGTGSRSGGMDGKGGFMAMVHPNETIIDHTKGQSAGGSGVTVNVIQSSEKAGTQETKQNADGSQSVDVFVSDIYGDGPRARALQNAFGLRRSGK